MQDTEKQDLLNLYYDLSDDGKEVFINLIYDEIKRKIEDKHQIALDGVNKYRQEHDEKPFEIIGGD